MKNFLLFFFIASTLPLFAQIGGLSASKISSYCTTVVGNNTIEFEPSFTSTVSRKAWDSNSDMYNLYSTSDSVSRLSAMNFRFTYGLWDKLEIGLSVSSIMSAASIGARYIIVTNDKFGIAAIAGLNMPMGNQTVDKSLRNTSNMYKAGLGLVTTYNFSDNLSIDFTGQYSYFLRETDDNNKGGFYLNSDVGYYVLNKKLQLITGIGFYNIKNDIGNHQVLTMYPGIEIAPGGDFLIVMSVPFDVYGRNEAKNVGFLFALTLTFN